MQILAGILLLGILVAFHELGHFLFAKMLGVRVLVFSIGFGPKIFSFTFNKTEYRLSLIPLGGYVKMFGESLDDELTEEEKKYSFLHQATWKKSLIAFAGPLFNFILPVILMFFLFVGKEEFFLPQIGTVAASSPAYKAGLKSKDIVKEIEGQKIQSFNDISSIVAKNPEKNLKFLIERQIDGLSTNLNITVTPQKKISDNPLEKETAEGRIGVMPIVEKPIITVLKDSPLFLLGFRNGDEIISINNKAINSLEDFKLALSNQIELSIKLKRSNSADEINIIVPNNLKNSSPTTLDKITKKYTSFIDKEILNKTMSLLKEEEKNINDFFGISNAKGLVTKIKTQSIASGLNIEKGDNILFINGEHILSSSFIEQNFINDLNKEHLLTLIKPDNSIVMLGIKFDKKTEKSLNLNSNLYNLFGVELMSVYELGKTSITNASAVEAFKKSTLQTYSIAAMTAKSLFMLVKMEVPSSQLGGPIMLFDVARQAYDKGIAFYIMVMCMLSVNLGLLNLLPIPALDGGHLLLFAIEAIQRKPLNYKTRLIVTQIGFLLLLSIMIFALFNDISRFFN